MNGYTDKYKEIYFSFLYRDEIYPAIKKIKGFSIKGLLSTLFKTFKREIITSFRKNENIINNKIWLYVESVNQLKSLEPLLVLENTILITDSDQLVSKKINNSIIKLHTTSKFKYRILRCFKFYKFKILFKDNFKAHINTIIKYDGIYESLLDVLKRHKPKAIVFSNDHNAFCRALLIAAKDCGVKTIYLQHAAVTDQFPPLKFDLNLLEGKDSFEKYQKAGPIEGKVELVGMLKFDAYFDLINKSLNIQSVGLALNTNDDFEKLFKHFFAYHTIFPNKQFYVRFHPSIDISKIESPSFFKISDTSKEDSFEFLTKIDVLISGDSSIHLEAALMNVTSFYPSINSDYSDYYGFIENKLTSVKNMDRLAEWIRNNDGCRKDIRENAKLYVETIDTEWDGNSKTKIFELIQNLNN